MHNLLCDHIHYNAVIEVQVLNCDAALGNAAMRIKGLQKRQNCTGLKIREIFECFLRIEAFEKIMI